MLRLGLDSLIQVSSCLYSCLYSCFGMLDVGWELTDDAGGFGLDLEEFLDGGEDADEVSVEHSLEDAGQAEDGQKHLLGSQRLQPTGRATAAQTAHHFIFIFFFFIFG